MSLYCCRFSRYKPYFEWCHGPNLVCKLITSIQETRPHAAVSLRTMTRSLGNHSKFSGCPKSLSWTQVTKLGVETTVNQSSTLIQRNVSCYERVRLHAELHRASKDGVQQGMRCTVHGPFDKCWAWVTLAIAQFCLHDCFYQFGWYERRFQRQQQELQLVRKISPSTPFVLFFAIYSVRRLCGR